MLQDCHFMGNITKQTCHQESRQNLQKDFVHNLSSSLHQNSVGSSSPNVLVSSNWIAWWLYHTSNRPGKPIKLKTRKEYMFFLSVHELLLQLTSCFFQWFISRQMSLQHIKAAHKVQYYMQIHLYSMAARHSYRWSSTMAKPYFTEVHTASCLMSSFPPP